MTKYAIIGGQYERYCHGTAETLRGAKILATKNIEYWNGVWHKPLIYAIEDVKEVQNFYGFTLAPKSGATPVAIWDDRKRKWVGFDEWEQVIYVR